MTVTMQSIANVVRPKTLAKLRKKPAPKVVILPINARSSMGERVGAPKLMKRTGKVATFVDAYVREHNDATIGSIKDAYRAKYSPKRLPGQILTYVKQYHASILTRDASMAKKTEGSAMGHSKQPSNVAKCDARGVFEYPGLAASKKYWASMKNGAPGVSEHPYTASFIQRGNSIIRNRVRDIISERLERAQLCEFNAVLTQYMYNYENPNDKELDYVEKYYQKYIHSDKFAAKIDWRVAELNSRNQLINYMYANSALYVDQLANYAWQVDKMVPEVLEIAQKSDCESEVEEIVYNAEPSDTVCTQLDEANAILDQISNDFDQLFAELDIDCNIELAEANIADSDAFSSDNESQAGDYDPNYCEGNMGVAPSGDDIYSDDDEFADTTVDLTSCPYCKGSDTWFCKISKECGCYACEEGWDDTYDEVKCIKTCQEGRCPYHSNECDSETCETDCPESQLGSDWSHHDSDYVPSDYEEELVQPTKKLLGGDNSCDTFKEDGCKTPIMHLSDDDSDSDDDVITPGGFEYADDDESKSETSAIPMNDPNAVLYPSNTDLSPSVDCVYRRTRTRLGDDVWNHIQGFFDDFTNHGRKSKYVLSHVNSFPCRHVQMQVPRRNFFLRMGVDILCPFARERTSYHECYNLVDLSTIIDDEDAREFSLTMVLNAEVINYCGYRPWRQFRWFEASNYERIVHNIVDNMGLQVTYAPPRDGVAPTLHGILRPPNVPAPILDDFEPTDLNQDFTPVYEVNDNDNNDDIDNDDAPVYGPSDHDSDSDNDDAPVYGPIDDNDTEIAIPTHNPDPDREFSSASTQFVYHNIDNIAHIGDEIWGQIDAMVTNMNVAGRFAHVLAQVPTFPQRYHEMSRTRRRYFIAMGSDLWDYECEFYPSTINARRVYFTVLNETNYDAKCNDAPLDYETCDLTDICDEYGTPYEMDEFAQMLDEEAEYFAPLSDQDSDSDSESEHECKQGNAIDSIIDNMTAPIEAAPQTNNNNKYIDSDDDDSDDELDIDEWAQECKQVDNTDTKSEHACEEDLFEQYMQVRNESDSSSEFSSDIDSSSDHEIDPVPQMVDDSEPLVQPTKKLLGGAQQCDTFQEHGCKPAKEEINNKTLNDVPEICHTPSPRRVRNARPRFVETMAGTRDTCPRQDSDISRIGPPLPLKRQVAEPSSCFRGMNQLEDPAYDWVDLDRRGQDVMLPYDHKNRWQSIDDTPRWTFTADTHVSKLPEYHHDLISNTVTVNMQAFDHWWHLKLFKMGDTRIPCKRTTKRDKEKYQIAKDLYLHPPRNNRMRSYEHIDIYEPNEQPTIPFIIEDDPNANDEVYDDPVYYDDEPNYEREAQYYEEAHWRGEDACTKCRPLAYGYGWPNRWTSIDDEPRWNIQWDTDVSELPGFARDANGNVQVGNNGLVWVDREAMRHMWHLIRYREGDTRIRHQANDAMSCYKFDMFMKTMLDPQLYPEEVHVDRTLHVIDEGDESSELDCPPSDDEAPTCRYCNSSDFRFSESKSVWICEECGEPMGGLRGGMLTGRSMQRGMGRSRSRMQQNSYIFNNNTDLRQREDDAFDAALGQAAAPQPESDAELDVDDILAELDATEAKMNEPSTEELLQQFNDLYESGMQDMRDINREYARRGWNTNPALDPVLTVPQSTPSPRGTPPQVYVPPEQSGPIIGFTSSESDEDDADESSDFAPLPVPADQVLPVDPPRDLAADLAFSAQVMIDDPDFRPIPVARVRTGMRGRLADFGDIDNPFVDAANNNVGAPVRKDVPGDNDNAPYAELIGVAIPDVKNDMGDTRLDEIANWFDEIHIFQSGNRSFKVELTENMRNMAVTIYSLLGINPQFRKGITTTQVYQQLRNDIQNHTFIEEDIDELDTLLDPRRVPSRERFTRYVDRALEFFNGLQLYNLRFKLRNATYFRNQKWVDLEKTVGVVLSKAAADRITNATGERRRQILQNEIVRKMDMYEDEDDSDYNVANFRDIKLSKAYDSNYYTSMLMNNGNDVNARLINANLNRFRRRNRGDRENYIRDMIMPQTIQNGATARELALQEWRERTNSTDDQLARFRIPSGDCVCKYIADELNRFYAALPKTKAGAVLRRRILVTPQQIANEFINAGVQNGFKNPGYSADDIMTWARNCNREFIDVYVYSPHKLRKVATQLRTKKYKNKYVLRLGFIPYDNHLYPVTTDSYSSIFEDFNYKDERLHKRLCAVRGAQRLDVDAQIAGWAAFDTGFDEIPETIQKWIDGEYKTVMYIAVPNLLRILIAVFEQKNIICDQCCGAGDIHIDTIIHPVTGLALIANEDYEAIRDICEKENSLETNSELNPMLPELMNPHTGFNVIASALFLKYLGDIKEVDVDGGLFGDYKKFKPTPIKQVIDDTQRDNDDPWSVAKDFKNCYPTCLANNDQDFPLFTKFDEIHDFDILKDKINIDYQYFISHHELYGYKFPSRVIHGRNLRRMVYMFPELRANIVSYRIPTRTMPANTFVPVLRKMKEDYPDSYKKIANQFIGNCNRSVYKTVFQYISTEEATVSALQSDIELANLNDFKGDMHTHSVMHCHTLDDYNSLYRLQITEEVAAKKNMSYVYDIVMDNYLTKLSQYLKYFYLIGVDVAYIKVDCFGLVFKTDKQRRMLSTLKDCRNDKKGYEPPKYEYTVTTDAPPRSNACKWHPVDRLTFRESMYISGPAGSGKTTRTFALLAHQIKHKTYPYVYCYVTAHQNKTTNDNRLKCLAALNAEGVTYSENHKKRCIYINNICIQFDSVERWRRSQSLDEEGENKGLAPDHFIIDEISMLNSQQLIALYDYKVNSIIACMTLAGDFDQLPPVKELVYRDVYNSTLFKRLCDCNEYAVPLELGKCRYEDQFTIDVLNFFRKHHRLPKCVANVIKPCDMSLDNNLVYTNRKRNQILQRKNKSADKLVVGDIVVFSIAPSKEQAGSHDPEDPSSTSFSADIVRTRAKEFGFYVGAEYKIDAIEEKHVTLVNDLDKRVTVNKQCVVSNVVGTVHKAQGSKIIGKGNIWEWERMDYNMRYTALTRFTKISNACIDNLTSFAVPVEHPTTYQVCVAQAGVTKICYYRKDGRLVVKPFDENKKVPEYIPYGDFMDPEWEAKEKQNREEYEAKYGSENERVPTYIILKNSKSKVLLDQYISVVNEQIEDGFHYAQCGLNMDAKSMLDECMEDIVDDPEAQILKWTSPFITMRNGVRYPAKDKCIRLKYTQRGKDEVLAEMRERINEVLVECTRVQTTTKYNGRFDGRLCIRNKKWVPVVDDSVYYARVVDVYNPDDEKHTELACTSKFFDAETHNVISERTDIKLRHMEYVRMAKPLHDEIRAGVVSGIRTFKFGNYRYFNDSFDNMARIILTKNKMQSLAKRPEEDFQNLYQEICTINSRMYFDIDIAEKHGKDPALVLKQFLEALEIHFNVMSNKRNRLNKKYVRVCKSTSKKVSYHISVLNEIFPTPDHQRYFTKKLSDYILANRERFHELVFDEDGKAVCAVDVNAYHNKQSVRLVFCNKQGKDNTLLPYKLKDDDTLQLVNFDAFNWKEPESPMNEIFIDKLKEYFICIDQADLWCFSEFSKIENKAAAKKRGGAPSYSRESNCDKKQIKQVEQLMRNVPGFDISATKAVYDLDGKFVKYNVFRCGEAMCPCCKKTHRRQNGVVQEYNGVWRFTCYQSGNNSIRLCE